MSSRPGIAVPHKPDTVINCLRAVSVLAVLGAVLSLVTTISEQAFTLTVSGVLGVWALHAIHQDTTYAKAWGMLRAFSALSVLWFSTAPLEATRPALIAWLAVMWAWTLILLVIERGGRLAIWRAGITHLTDGLLIGALALVLMYWGLPPQFFALSLAGGAIASLISVSLVGIPGPRATSCALVVPGVSFLAAAGVVLAGRDPAQVVLAFCLIILLGAARMPILPSPVIVPVPMLSARWNVIARGTAIALASLSPLPGIATALLIGSAFAVREYGAKNQTVDQGGSGLDKARRAQVAHQVHDLSIVLQQLWSVLPLVPPGQVHDQLTTIARNLTTLMFGLRGQLSAGALLNAEPRVDLNEVISAAACSIGPMAGCAGVTVDIENPIGTAHVAVNGQALRRVLDNLLSNAMHVSQPGQVVRLTLGTDDDARYTIAVTDQGPGFPPDLARRLVEGVRTAHDRGGMGLEIAHRLVSEMGGSISVCSSEAGSTVTIRLPRTQPANSFTEHLRPVEQARV